MKKFEVTIIMAVGLAEDVHFHEFVMDAKDEFEIFEQIKNCSWFHCERTVLTIEKGIRFTKKYQKFIQVKNISDICIVEVPEGVNC